MRLVLFSPGPWLAFVGGKETRVRMLCAYFLHLSILIFTLGFFASVTPAHSAEHEHLSYTEAKAFLSYEPADFRISLDEKSGELNLHGVFPSECEAEKNIRFSADADQKQIGIFIGSRDCIKKNRQSCIDLVENLKNKKTTLEAEKAKTPTERKCEVLGKTLIVKSKVGELIALSDDEKKALQTDLIAGEFKVGVAQDDTFAHEVNSQRPRFSFVQHEQLAYKTKKQKELDAQIACKNNTDISSNSNVSNPGIASFSKTTGDIGTYVGKQVEAAAASTSNTSSTSNLSAVRNNSNTSTQTGFTSAPNRFNQTQDYAANPYYGDPANPNYGYPYGNYPNGNYPNGNYPYGNYPYGQPGMSYPQPQEPFFTVPPSPIATPGTMDNPMTEIQYFYTVNPYTLDPAYSMQNLFGSTGGIFPGLQNFIQTNFPGVAR